MSAASNKSKSQEDSTASAPKPDSLRAISLPADASRLVALGPPAAASFDGMSATRHRAIVDDARALVSSLLNGEVGPSDVTLEGQTEIESWFQVLLRAAQWYAVSIVVGMRNHPTEYPGIRWAGMSKILGEDEEKPADHLAISRMIFAVFGNILVSGNLILVSRHSPAPTPLSLVRSTESLLHTELTELWALRVAAEKGDYPFAELADEVFEASLHSLRYVYVAEPKDSYEARGPFSAINLPDFVRMAARDDRAVKKYKGRLAGAFEQQLALIVQSFGGLVIQTRPGDRTVDLFCISVDVEESFSFLVEAKTTKRPYGLPTDDERALVEYIRESRRLSTLPRLRFILLIAPAAARTLEGKLKKVETEVGIPVRFASAKGLARLRDLVVGPQLLSEISDVLLDSPHIVGDDFGDRVVAVVRAKHQAHENLVRTMLGIDASSAKRRQT